MRQKNQIELNSGTGAEGEAQSAAVREIEASAAKASLERPARADEVIGKPVFRVRLLAESLEEAAGFKTVSAVTPASG
jgi:RNA-directed DNA polymerase